GGRQALPGRLPFGQDAGVLGAAFGRVVLAQQDVAASTEAVSQGDDGLPALAVEAIGRDGSWSGHEAHSQVCGSLPQNPGPLCRTADHRQVLLNKDRRRVYVEWALQDLNL